MHRMVACGIALAWVITPLTWAQESAAGPKITRADLAEAFLRLEAAVAQAGLEGDALGEANKTFDRATLSFFGGKMAEALAEFNDVTLNALEEHDNAALRYGLSLRAAVLPSPYVVSRGETPQAQLVSLYAPTGDVGDGGEPVTLRVRDSAGNVVAEVTLDGPVNGVTTVPFADAKGLSPGQYALDVDAGTATPLQLGRWTVVAESLEGIRDANAARLENLDVEAEDLRQAKSAVAARNGLLSDTPSQENTAQLVFDPNEIAAEVIAEIEALETGNDPFDGRRGDYWRTFQPDSGDPIAIRVYVPANLDLATPQPLVVAFHGAGGDENMFMDAYGGGAIKALADTQGFLLVTPLTYAFSSGTGEKFDALLEAMGHNYAIDGSRVYVLGHSMGGGMTSAVITTRPDAVAAASPICGFRNLPESVTSIPPTYVIAAEFDPLAQAPRVEAAAKAAQEQGLPVEYKLMENYGHTLVVGDVLPDVIAWLFTHSK